MKTIENFIGVAATPAPRSLIYVRSAVNDENQLAERLEDARDLAQMYGLDVAADDCTAEHGSGADVGRPGLQRILEQAARGEISHLVTPRVSNLSRSYHDLYQILFALTEAGVKVITTPDGSEPGLAPEIETRHLVAKR